MHMFADALGACVEGWPSKRIESVFPTGLRDLQHHNRGYGRYTDDTQMTLALARSIVQLGRVDAGRVAKAYAADFDPYRGYGGFAQKILGDLKSCDADWQSIRNKHIPGEGSYANGGAMRISPVGIAYRNAPAAVLYKAVKDACACTHTHPTAVDAAFVLAAAVGWLIRQEPANTLVQAQELRASLLDYLMGIACTEGMRQKLEHLSSHLVPTMEVAAEKNWKAYLTLGSPLWQNECQLQLELSEGNEFQIKADSAVAAALCAFLHHGLVSRGQTLPENAIIAAVHYGGDTDTVAAMAGACVGALHGYASLPERWVQGLENGVLGRDEALRYAHSLAQLDVRG
ncbi:ADP-ribosylation/Crystallin J1 [Dunaliella salina]|uniref:ADP-ribosylhydrolase ARH3 n=1 Tax=Dunaliella salina TaxID=3046 RepID=A0ABQ7FV15_DUNSA|nr:ADP-ribosylation/Crystallin J1 [Dunaliella salina]|eukprot:KAF5826239.1 ADP-ribosylation/Crystallin J1 [Dunaliella salina]